MALAGVRCWWRRGWWPRRRRCRAAAWGYNGDGQLGQQQHHRLDGAGGGGHSGVLAGKTVTAIAAGLYHTCAVADGKAYCWGCNDYGQLGNNSDHRLDGAGGGGHRRGAGRQDGHRDHRRVRHTCAVADGKAYCWGDNVDGQLGNDNSPRNSTVPVAVRHLRAAGRQDGHRDHRRGLTTRVRWPTARRTAGAYNAYGQLGNNSTTDSTVPVAVNTTPGALAGKTVTAITAGVDHTCAVADGKAYCWGYNDYGQLGNNSTTRLDGAGGGEHRPGPLAGKTVTAITAGVITRVRWPTAGRTAGATTTTGSSATTAPPTRRCRWR